MSNKTYNDNNFNLLDHQQFAEYKTSKIGLSKQDIELFDDAKNIPAKIIRIKRTGVIGKTEKWKIFENDEVILTLEASKFNKKEQAFLRGLEGINYLIAECKRGIKSVNDLRAKIKKHFASLPKKT